jgi:hypothetical protein
VIRDHGERVIIDAICNSGRALVLGIVPAQPCLRDPMGESGIPHGLLRQGHDLRVKVISYEGTAELMSYYPATVKDWSTATPASRPT